MFYLIFHATLISKLNWQLSFMCVSYGYLLSSSPAGPPASWHLARPPPKHFPSRLRLLPLAIPSCHTISVVWTPAAPGPGRAPAPVPSPPPAQRKSPLAHPKNSPRVSNDVPPPTFALSQQFHLPWLLFFLSALSLSFSLLTFPSHTLSPEILCQHHYIPLPVFRPAPRWDWTGIGRNLNALKIKSDFMNIDWLLSPWMKIRFCATFCTPHTASQPACCLLSLLPPFLLSFCCLLYILTWPHILSQRFLRVDLPVCWRQFPSVFCLELLS